MHIHVTNAYARADVLNQHYQHRGVFRIHYMYNVVSDRYIARIGISKLALSRLMLTNKKLPEALIHAPQVSTPDHIYYEIHNYDSRDLRDDVDEIVKQLKQLGAHSGNNT